MNSLVMPARPTKGMRFDSDLHAAMGKVQEEQAKRQKLQQEHDRLITEKFTFSQELENAKAEVDVLTNKNRRLTRELQELSQSNSSENELGELRRVRMDMERRVAELEEEIDELSTENSELQNYKLKLHMDQEKLRSKHSREMDDLEREMEDVRDTGARKIKAMESKLADLEEEQHDLHMEKRELERKLLDKTSTKAASNPESERRLRGELRRTKALLQDAQMQLGGGGGAGLGGGPGVGRRGSVAHSGPSASADGGVKLSVRTLQSQLEDTQSALTAALKSKAGQEAELQELHARVDAAQRAKTLAEERASRLQREKNELEGENEEKEEEAALLLRRYQTSVAQCSAGAAALRNQSEELEEANAAKRTLSEEIDAMQNKMDNYERFFVPKEKVIVLENRLKDLEQKMEFDHSVKVRLEGQTSKLKEMCSVLRDEKSKMAASQQAEERLRRALQKEINGLHEEMEVKAKRDIDLSQEVRALEQSVEVVESEKQQMQAELTSANQRIERLTMALSKGLDGGDDSDDNEVDQYSDDASYAEDDDEDDTFVRRRSALSSVGASEC